MSDIADKLRAVQEHAATIDMLATQRGSSLDDSHDQHWGQCLLAIRSLLANLPDPEEVREFVQKATDLRNAGQMQKTHDLAMKEDFVITDTSYVDDFDAALAKLEEKP